jgi:hypothetical protein
MCLNIFINNDSLFVLFQVYLYGKETKHISYNEFINRELILFSNMDNERSIPSAVDGLKPGQRKVIFTCLKRNLIKELKVAQLAGSVAELSSYHHGEVSLINNRLKGWLVCSSFYCKFYLDISNSYWTISI